MTVTTQEVLMGLGSFQADLDWNRDLVGELVYGGLLVLFEGQRPLSAWVITRSPEKGPEAIKIGGDGLDWLMGTAEEGPLIQDEEYPSGANRLSNGDWRDGLRFWSVGERTMWTPLGTAASGPYVYTMPLPVDIFETPLGDDVMVSEDSVSDLRHGQVYESRFTIGRVGGSSASVGRLRQRHVYVGGPFHHQNLMPAYNLWGTSVRGDIVMETNPTQAFPGSSGRVFRIQTAQPNLVQNPSFDNGLTGWAEGTATWGTVAAPDGNALRTAGGGPAVKSISSHYSLGQGPSFFYPVLEGEEYLIGGWHSTEAATDGDGILTAYLGIGEGDPLGGVNDVNKWTGTDERWDHQDRTLRITRREDGWLPTHLRPIIYVLNHTAGAHLFDNVYLHRTKGNIDTVTGPTLGLVPERAYTWLLPFHFDYRVTGGTIQMRAVCTAVNRPTHIEHGPTLQHSEGAWAQQRWDFRAPSGYDYVQFQIFAQDVYGGPVWISEGTIVDADDTTSVKEVRSEVNVTGVAPFACASNVPEMAVSLHVELIAEVGATGWGVTNGELFRIGIQPATGEHVARDLLRSRQHGANLLRPGNIYPAGVLTSDFRIHRLHNLEALGQLSRSGYVLPYREWRSYIDANLDLLLDWGTPEEIFRRRDITFGPTGVVLHDPPRLATSDERTVSNVLVVGATNEDGQQIIGNRDWLFGRERLPPNDYYGNPLFRYRVIQNGLLDHARLADSIADYEFEHSGTRTSVDATSGDPRSLGEINVGDWANVYMPEIGLTDEENEARLENGLLADPVELRLMEKTTEYGGDPYRLELHRHGFDPVVLKPKWSDATKATFKLADTLPEFAGETSADFERWSRSVPPQRRRWRYPRG